MRFTFWLNGILIVAFSVLIPVSFRMGWIRSVTFVSVLSEVALVLGSWSTWAAAYSVVQQKKSDAQSDS